MGAARLEDVGTVLLWRFLVVVACIIAAAVLGSGVTFLVVRARSRV